MTAERPGVFRQLTSSPVVPIAVVLGILLLAGLVPVGGRTAVAPPPREDPLPLVSLAGTNVVATPGPHNVVPGHFEGRPPSTLGALGLSTAIRPSSYVPLDSHPDAGSTLGYWTNLSSVVGSLTPTQRFGSSMVYDSTDGYVLLFGGAAITSAFGQVTFGDTWTFSNGSWSQLTPPEAPSARWGACMAYDPAEQGVVLFGGTTIVTSGGGAAGIWQNDTWLFAHGSWRNLSATLSVAPSARGQMYCDFDSQYGGIIVFGGWNGTAYRPDTWSFSNHQWTNITGTISGAPPPLAEGAMAYDPAENESVLFGGLDQSGNDYNGTWTFQSGVWTNITGTAGTLPASNVEPGLAYDAALSALVMYGGFFPPIYNTLLFSAGTWTDVTGQVQGSMGALAAPAMTYEPNGAYVLAIGGYTLTSSFVPLEFNATYAFGPAIVALGHAQPQVIDLGQTVNLTMVVATNATPLDYSWSGPGCPAVNRSWNLCIPGTVGNFSAVGSVNDSAGDSANYTFYFGVNPDPLISGFTASPSTVTVGQLVRFNTSVINGTPPYHYTYLGLPPGCASRSVSQLGCSPNGPGNYSVEVEAQDVPLFAVFANLTLTVNAAPSATLAATPAVLDVGQTLRLNASLVGGTPPMTFVWSSLPPGCTSANVSAISCVPAAPWTGAVIVKATDNFGVSSIATTSILVNSAPTVTQAVVAPSEAEVGVRFTLWVNVSGGTGALTYGYSGLPPGCGSFVASMNTCSPTGAGSFTVHVNITDQVGGLAAADIPITVAPALVLGPVTTDHAELDLGQSVNLSVSPTGGVVPMHLLYSGLPGGCTTSDSPHLTCTPRETGSFNVTVTVTDRVGGGSNAAASLTVFGSLTVSSFPVFGSPATLGSAVYLVPEVTGGSGTYALAYSGLPTGCVSANETNLTCRATAAGSFNVTVTVTDSVGGLARESAIVIVSAPSGAASTSLPSWLPYAVVGIALVSAATVLLLRRRRRSGQRSDTLGEESPPAD